MWTYGSGRGNVEAAVVSRLSADETRAIFTPPNVTVEAADWDAVERLSFRQDADSETPETFLLHAATFLEDGRIAIELNDAAELPPTVRLGFDDGNAELEAAESTQPVQVDRSTAVVWLSKGGERVSNLVPVDDPESLGAQLRTQGGTKDRPDELDLSDVETPIGRLLIALQSQCIFDMDELPTSRAAKASEEPSEGADDDLWERLEKRSSRSIPECPPTTPFTEIRQSAKTRFFCDSGRCWGRYPKGISSV